MLAAPCIPPATGFFIQLYFVVFERVCADRLDATMVSFVFGARLRRLPDGRLLVVIQHVLRESQMGGGGGGLGDWGDARPDRPGHPPAVSLRSPASPLR